VKNSLDQTGYASLPASALGVLADLRCSPEILVALAGERAWVRWETGDPQVLSRLLPVSGVELYVNHEGQWYRQGHHLPAFHLPVHLPARPLHAVLTPAPVLPISAPRADHSPIRAQLVADDRPRLTSAMMCKLSILKEWADWATTQQLSCIRGARRGRRVLLLGRRLPHLAGSERFWGGRLVLPLGYRLEPALPETELLQAWGVKENEFVLYHAEGALILSQSVFEPLTRAGIRVAHREEAVDG
jgi:hypothetical protein